MAGYFENLSHSLRTTVCHGTEITFDLADVSLLRFKKPLISKLEFPGYLSLPRKWLPVSFDVMGADAAEEGGYSVTASIFDPRGRILSTCSRDLTSERKMVLDLSKLKPGKYEVELKITDKSGTLYSEKTQPLFLIDHSGS